MEESAELWQVWLKWGAAGKKKGQTLEFGLYATLHTHRVRARNTNARALTHARTHIRA